MSLRLQITLKIVFHSISLPNTRHRLTVYLFRTIYIIPMEIIHDEEDTRFYASLEGGQAELTYSITDEGHMDFDHTFVPENHRGQGVADKLVKAGLEHAKAQNCQIIPSCPVVETYVKRHSEYDDIVCWK